MRDVSSEQHSGRHYGQNRPFSFVGEAGDVEHLIVVGVSGGERQSQLDWAIEASLRWNSTLLIVHCYEGRFAVELPEPDEDELRLAHSVLDAAVLAARARGVRADSVLIDGFAGEALVEVSKDAQLLVVGSRHRGHFSHAVHPSVSAYCLHHSHCPVTIVPLVD